MFERSEGIKQKIKKKKKTLKDSDNNLWWLREGKGRGGR